MRGPPWKSLGMCRHVAERGRAAGSAKPATELRRRTTTRILGRSVLGCPLSRRQKARPHHNTSRDNTSVRGIMETFQIYTAELRRRQCGQCGGRFGRTRSLNAISVPNCSNRVPLEGIRQRRRALIAWCLLLVLIRQGLRGGSGPQRLIRALGAAMGPSLLLERMSFDTHALFLRAPAPSSPHRRGR